MVEQEDKLRLVIEWIVKNEKALRSSQRKVQEIREQSRQLGVQARREAYQARQEGMLTSKQIQKQIEPLRRQKEAIGADIAQQQKNMGLRRNRIAKQKVLLSQERESIRRTEQLKKTNERFRGEWMSLMFAGMALQSVFGGYIQNVLQMLGITDTLAALFMTFLLPAIEPLLPLFFGLMEVLFNLPNPVKKAIGIFMILVTAIGFAMFVAGAFVLAVVGIMIILAKAGIAVSVTAVSFYVILAGALIFVISVVLAFMHSFGILGLLLEWFVMFPLKLLWGVMKAVYNVFMAFVSFLNGDTSGAINHLKEAVRGLLKPFYDLWKAVERVLESLAELPGGHGIGFLKDLGGSAIGKARNILGLAKGGIVTNPTMAMVGEKGPEAVIPLNQIGSLSPTVNIDATVSSDMDIEALANRVSEILTREFRSVI